MMSVAHFPETWGQCDVGDPSVRTGIVAGEEEEGEKRKEIQTSATSWTISEPGSMGCRGGSAVAEPERRAISAKQTIKPLHNGLLLLMCAWVEDRGKEKRLAIWL